MASAQASKNVITLKGSVDICTEFFAYSINSILYQRGIYPPDQFTSVQKYGLSMLYTTDAGLKAYLSQVLSQLSDWLMKKTVQKLVVVVTGVDSGEVLERWVFDVQTDKAAADAGSSSAKSGAKPAEKSEKEITAEIAAIIRQITASVSFLPLLNEQCTFDLLVYTDSEIEVPQTWEESDPKFISNSEEVRLRSFTTKIHKVEALVSYKVGDE